MKILILTILTLIQTAMAGEIIEYRIEKYKSVDLASAKFSLELFKEKYSFYDLDKSSGTYMNLTYELSIGFTLTKQELYSEKRNAMSNGEEYLKKFQIVKDGSRVVIPAHTQINHVKEVDAYFIDWYWRHYTISETTDITNYPQRCFIPYLEVMLNAFKMESIELQYEEISCE